MQKICHTCAMLKHIHLAHVYIEKQWKSSTAEWKKHILCEWPHFVQSHIIFFCETQKGEV